MSAAWGVNYVSTPRLALHLNSAPQGTISQPHMKDNTFGEFLNKPACCHFVYELTPCGYMCLYVHVCGEPEVTLGHPLETPLPLLRQGAWSSPDRLEWPPASPRDLSTPPTTRITSVRHDTGLFFYLISCFLPPWSHV